MTTAPLDLEALANAVENVSSADEFEPSAMLAVLGDCGLEATFAHSRIAWRVSGLAR